MNKINLFRLKIQSNVIYAIKSKDTAALNTIVDKTKAKARDSDNKVYFLLFLLLIALAVVTDPLLCCLF